MKRNRRRKETKQKVRYIKPNNPKTVNRSIIRTISQARLQENKEETNQNENRINQIRIDKGINQWSLKAYVVSLYKYVLFIFIINILIIIVASDSLDKIQYLHSVDNFQHSFMGKKRVNFRYNLQLLNFKA